jgi:hypothetical protein
MVGLTRTAGFGIAFVVALASPRLARAGVELSLRAPVGVAVSDATRFELGLRSDLLIMSRAGLGLGLVGEVRSVSLSQRAQEIGGAIAWLPDQGGNISLGPVLDAGYGTQGSRRYSFERLSLQLRGRIGTDDLAYAATSGIFVGARQTVSGPGATEWIIGVDIGGGLIAGWFLMVRSIVNSG